MWLQELVRVICDDGFGVGDTKLAGLPWTSKTQLKEMAKRLLRLSMETYFTCMRKLLGIIHIKNQCVSILLFTILWEDCGWITI